MADRYTKENILQYPKLQPTRHYESENPTPWQPPARQIPKRDPLLDNLDDLDNLMKICDLLPPGLADVIKAMTDVLSKHTQGLIIMRLQKEIHEPKYPPEVPPEDHPEPDEPWKYIPQTPEIPPYVPPSTPTPHGMDDDEPHKPGEGERYPDHPKQPDTYEEEHEKHGNNPPDVPEPVGPGKEEWPGTHTEYKNGENNNEKRNIYISDRNDDEQYDVVITDKEPAAVADVEVDDIFSAEPEVEINLLPTDSLVDLARKGYMQDDADIKEHYTTMMTQISQRFYQVMTALAEDGNMLDYSDLMQDFDGTAVTTDDPNQQHLIDEICRNDVLYDQKLRQMNLTHTPEKTLVMTRAMTAAEGERERYLQSDYKTNMPTIVSGLSNDLLQKAREESEKKYKEAAYNMYKFLDSATKYTNTMLNMKIDSAIAKAQLANTGSDIFAITPPPQPLADNTDDNFDTTVKHQETAQKFIDEQKKDSKKGSEVDNGASSGGGSGGSGGSSAGGPVGPAPGKGKENIPADAEAWTVDLALQASNILGIPCDWIWGQWANESGRFNAQSRAENNYAGLGPHNEYADNDAFLRVYTNTIRNYGACRAKTFHEFIEILQTDESPYCASPPGVEPYYEACSGALGNAGTVIS